MTTIRFGNLTTDVVDALIEMEILNGCGGKGSYINPPDWLFTASCYHHDFNYWLGGDERDRKKADKQFYDAMRKDVKRASWWKRPWYRLMAWSYYRAVRLFAKSHFHYADVERTLEDLELAFLDDKVV